MGLHTLCALVLSVCWCASSAAPTAGDVLPLLACSVWLFRCWWKEGRRMGPLALRLLAAGLAAVSSLPPELPTDPSHVASLLDGQSRSPLSHRISATIGSLSSTASGSLRLTLSELELEKGRGPKPWAPPDGAGQRPRAARLDGALALYIRHPAREWTVGDRLSFSARLRPITNFHNPGENDWRAWNARRGVFVSSWLWDDGSVDFLGRSGGISGWLADARVAVSAAARRRGGEGGRLVAALISGDRAKLAQGQRRSLRDAGLAHVLAISGLHMGLVSGVLFWLTRRLGLLFRAYAASHDVKRPAALVAASGLFAYAALSGGGVSVERSVLMVGCWLAAAWWGMKIAAADSLALAAIVLAFSAGSVVREAAFQLSFAAVGGLLLFARLRADSAKRHGQQRRPLISLAVNGLGVSLVAWCSTLPLAAQHFGRVSLVAPLTNLVGLPIVTGTVVSGLAGAVALALCPPLAPPLFGIASICADAILGIAGSAAVLPGAGRNVPAPGWPMIGLLYALATSRLLRRGRPRRWALAALGLALAGVLGQGIHERYRSDLLRITFVSVGQGDSTILRLPGGGVMVVDGGSPGRGKLAVAPQLRRMWVRTIDYLVASHVQDDHWRGLEDLLEGFTIRQFWYSGGDCQHWRFRRFLDKLRQNGVEVLVITRETMTRPEAEWTRRRLGVEVLWPPDDAGDCADNDRSLVLRLGFMGKTVVLGGDAGERVEGELLAAGAYRGADVLKVPHHGSRGSSSPALVRATCPAIAVASVGLANRYHLPHPEVEARYLEAGCAFYRSDRDGAVELSLGRRMELSTRFGSATPGVDYSRDRPDK
ncbi:MAG: DNA internalization-related competence protein ComEC/Rec2 [Candidatus Binatia bacterium]